MSQPAGIWFMSLIGRRHSWNRSIKDTSPDRIRPWLLPDSIEEFEWTDVVNNPEMEIKIHFLAMMNLFFIMCQAHSVLKNMGKGLHIFWESNLYFCRTTSESHQESFHRRLRRTIIAHIWIRHSLYMRIACFDNPRIPYLLWRSVCSRCSTRWDMHLRFHWLNAVDTIWLKAFLVHSVVEWEINFGASSFSMLGGIQTTKMSFSDAIS